MNLPPHHYETGAQGWAPREKEQYLQLEHDQQGIQGAGQLTWVITATRLFQMEM
jgi:hypothetical protein